MARADQIKALFRAYAGNEDAQFISVALQVAADEARRGHSKLAAELRELIEKARAPAAPRARARTLPLVQPRGELAELLTDRKSTRLNSSHSQISYAVFCLKKKKGNN